MTTSSSASPPPSNGNSGDAAAILLGMELGQLRHKTSSHEDPLTAHARSLIMIMECLILISRHSATRSQEPTTASGTATTAASIPGRTGTLFSTLSRLTKKLAKRASPEVGLWLLGLIWRPYLFPIALAAWGLVKAYLKWLEPLWRASFG